jgi:APA family basic amino acid/polyamine antiporter
MGWAEGIIAVAGVAGITSVLLVMMLSGPRVFLAMARDGLVPRGFFGSVHPRFRTPWKATILIGFFVMALAGLGPIDWLLHLTNIGTLFAFVLVCIGIPILRMKEPDRHRPFRVPFGPFLLPILGAASCIALMVYLPPASWWRFAGWLLLGLGVYCAYGYSRSVLGRREGRPPFTPGTLKVAALGFVLVAAGMFTIPHDAGLGRLLAEAGNAAAEDHGRALWGLVLMALGLVLGVGGVAAQAQTRS